MDSINVESVTVDLDGGESVVDSISVMPDVVAQYCAALIAAWLVESAAGDAPSEFRIAVAVNRGDL